MSPFQALSTALGGTVGTGNVAGVTLAIAVGGPGVLFWMWVSAFLGMATKYSEVLLAVKFRERNENGERVGGPMYYIRNGLGRSFRPLAYIFCYGWGSSGLRHGKRGAGRRDTFRALDALYGAERESG